MGIWVFVLLLMVVFALFVYLILDIKLEIRSSEVEREERFRGIVKSLLNAYVKQEYCDQRVSNTDNRVNKMVKELQEFSKLCKACSKSSIKE